MNAKLIARIAAAVAVAGVLALGAEAAHTQPAHSTSVVTLADGGSGSTTTPPTTPANPGSNPWE